MRDDRILFLDLSCPGELPEITRAPARISLPTRMEYISMMHKYAFRMVDRTLQAEIRLQSTSVDFTQYRRMKVVVSEGDHAAVQEIARRSFLQDHRFCITVEENKELTEYLIEREVEQLRQCFVCRFKGIVVGFLAIEEDDESKGRAFIRLAAVEEGYRRTGAAISLYSAVAQHYKEAGFHTLIGRISSGNTAVMNLYICLGAVFSAPRDIFIKE